MNLKQVATIILERRARMTHVVMPGDIQAAIGQEGMAEALRRRWLEADYDFGALKVSSNLGVVREMEAAAEADCEKCKKKDCVCKPEDGDESNEKKTGKPWESLPITPSVSLEAPRAVIVEHSRRLTEFSAPGSGQPDRPVAPVAPTAQPNAASNRPSEDHMVGEDVIIAEEGKSYTAKIKSKRPDGTYELSFGQNRPVAQRNYRKEEIQQVKQGDTQLVQ